MSQPPKTKSSRPAKGTKSLILGDLCSNRFPSLMVPSWVSEPTGSASPRRISSTPAMKVVLTAPPIPGMRTPSLPFGGVICSPFFKLLAFNTNPPYPRNFRRLLFFQVQQSPFYFKSTRKAAQLPSTRNDPVTWYENGNRVSAACPPNGPRSPGVLRFRCYLAVGLGLSKSNGLDRPPDLMVKRGPLAQIYRNFGRRDPVCEV